MAWCFKVYVVISRNDETNRFAVVNENIVTVPRGRNVLHLAGPLGGSTKLFRRQKAEGAGRKCGFCEKK